MKKIVVILAVLVVIVGGYFIFTHNTFNTPTRTPVEATPAQGKLDMNVVCNNALTYMKFADQTSADTFVAECKDGKHPEVIEHYKTQMHLGEGASI